MAAAFALLLLATVGCGGNGQGTDGSSPTTSTTTSALTKAQLIDKAEGICVKSWHEMLKRYASFKGTFSLAVGEIFLPSILFWYDNISFFGPPEGDHGEIKRVLRALQATVVTGLNRPYSFGTPAELSHHFRRSNRLMRAYGIDRCVVTPSSFPT